MYFLSSSIAPTTKRQYSSCLNRYLQFGQRYNLKVFPLYQQNVILFVSYISNSSISNIKIHIAAIKFYAHIHGYDTERHNLNSFHRLYLLLRGIKRTQGNNRKKTKRSPITPELLKIIRFNLFNSSMIYEDKLMIWAAMLTAFFGFMRVSEYTSSGTLTYLPESTLCYQDMYIRNDTYNTHIDLLIKSSKSDPFRLGAVIRLSENNTELCPVNALKEYITHHPSKQGPLFAFQSKKFLTRRFLCKTLQQHLPENEKNFSSHSFRIGAATTAAAAGFPRWLIQSLGRWTSDCYRQYLRIPDKTFNMVSRSLTYSTGRLTTFDPDNIKSN